MQFRVLQEARGLQSPTIAVAQGSQSPTIAVA